MIIGVDLGTTHSLVGVWKNGKPELVPNALGSLLTPSVVGLDDHGEMIVGALARERLVTHPDRTVAAFKRFMGTPRATKLGKHTLRPEELSSLVLKSLIDDVEKQCGERPTEAIISVPAYFSDAQRKATRAAGELAGIRVERLINEPTAAALAYGLNQRGAENRFLVLDLGGGTFDVSILEMFDGVMEVHASAGDNYLGGEDFLDQLFDAALQKCGITEQDLDLCTKATWRERVETAKRQLGTRASVDIEVPHGTNSTEVHCSFSQEEFENLCAPLLERMQAPIERALNDASLTPDDLDEVVLVGGASRMLMVSRLVSRMFGRLPLRHIYPDEAIGIGATVMAALKSRQQELDEVIMTDVCPYTMGVEVSERSASGQIMEGLFSPIIERNMAVPVSRSGLYRPMRNGQRLITLNVYQGESPRVSDNVLLGTLNVYLPVNGSTETGAEVRFTYDVNGLLEVEAVVMGTDERYRLVIESNPGVLSKDEIRQRLKALEKIKIHPRDQQANQALMTRAKRLYAECLGDYRKMIGEWLTAFQAELESQDESRIRKARKRMAEMLEQVETGAFR
ncbi:molecular chaperone HscC [Oleiagrimonas citrea]|uniref:Molecular chaperone HscC n=1 Tax=Oleiagrimonas citrea TaxID=1665687 RepID=A0A846ZJ54_9GAMM|nr:molecular chaperone HscC [Oleiagrimonas citrea]NKZ37623.1 molecular chaperone HscC [Oleiagrimonas citrea]